MADSLGSSPRRRRRWARASHLGVSLILGAALTPAASAQFTFNPSIGALYLYTDDTGLRGEERPSDSSVRLGLTMPLAWAWPKGTFALTYRPHFERFETLEELDHDGHRVVLGLNLEPTPLWSLRLGGSYSRLQQQGGSSLAEFGEEDPLTEGGLETGEDDDVFLGGRFLLERRGAGLRLSRSFRKTWSWDLGLGYLEREIEPVEDATGSDPIEGREASLFSVGLTRAMSPRLSLGGEYGLHLYDLAISGGETVHSVRLNSAYALSPDSSLTFSVGGFRRTPDEEAEQRLGEATTGFLGAFSYDRRFRSFSLGVIARHQPSVGNALLGSSKRSTARLSLSRSSIRGRWGGELFVGYNRRDPTNPEQEVLDFWTVGSGLNVGFGVERIVGLRLLMQYVDRVGAREASYYRVGAGLVLHPLGRTRLAGARE